MSSTTDALDALGRKLDETGAQLATLDAYYGGYQPLAYLSDAAREALGTGYRKLSVGFPRLAVDSLAERLELTGFQLRGAQEPDQDLWRIWEQNQMAEGAAQAHTDALVYGRSFVIVWAGPNGTPQVTVESPRQVAVIWDAGTRTVQAAMKRWSTGTVGLTDTPGPSYAVVYEPDRITRFMCPSPGIPTTAGAWQQQEVLDNPLRTPPVVPILNRGRLLELDGCSEMAPLLDLSDALNKLSSDMMVSSEFYARPRRWVSGLEVVEDEQGNPVNPFSDAPGSVWQAEAPETRFGEFSGASLDGYANAVATVTQQIGALSGLPPHYLGLHGDQPTSADAIRSAEASLVARVRQRQRSFGQGWAQVARLMLAVRDGRAPSADVDVVWSDPETRTVSETADAVTKLVQAGILPTQAALARLGYSPEQIATMRTMARQSALDTAALAAVREVRPS